MTNGLYYFTLLGVDIVKQWCPLLIQLQKEFLKLLDSEKLTAQQINLYVEIIRFKVTQHSNISMLVVLRIITEEDQKVILLNFQKEKHKVILLQKNSLKWITMKYSKIIVKTMMGYALLLFFHTFKTVVKIKENNIWRKLGICGILIEDSILISYGCKEETIMILKRNFNWDLDFQVSLLCILVRKSIQ